MPNKPEYTRFLPHYHPVGATFFVTFRLNNSLPNAILDEISSWYRCEKERIIHSIPAVEQHAALALIQRDYFRKYDHALDKCLQGPDFLKNPLAASQIIKQLDRFDSNWYRLLAFTIMPNHVHVILDFSIQLESQNPSDTSKYKNLDYVVGRIKGASSRYINIALGTTGRACWQDEYHDRYIRDKRHLLAAIDYIKQNPVSAKLCTHWREHPFTWVHRDFW